MAKIYLLNFDKLTTTYSTNMKYFKRFLDDVFLVNV